MAVNLFQLHNDGSLWQYSGTPGNWVLLDNNPATTSMVARGGTLYQMHADGSIWKYTGPPMTGWVQINDNPPATSSIVSGPGGLFKVHRDRTIHTLNSAGTGWLTLYFNPLLRQFATGKDHWFVLLGNGGIWEDDSANDDMIQLDNNPATQSIVAAAADLYQVHGDGSIWKYTGPPLTGWQELDNNGNTRTIAAGGGSLYQLHGDGSIWLYTGPPLTGWQQLDNNPATVAISTGGGKLYQLHGDGSIWQYTGPPLTGWQQIDNNPSTVSIVAG
jgi:hypothetical protein